MSIKGQSFTSAFAGGAHVDFGVGSAGLADLFKAGHTVAILEKGVNNNRGLLGGYTDTAAASPLQEYFITNNSGGRLFGTGDFSNGFPDPGVVGSPGLGDDFFRWLVLTKVSGSTHYRWHYYTFATDVWVHGESIGAANHSDPAGTAVMFSTWAIYPQGFDSQDVAAIVTWATPLSDADVEASLSKWFIDVYSVTDPKTIWSMKYSSASFITDLTGGGADETARASIASSPDPVGFDYMLALPDGERIFARTDGPNSSEDNFSDGTPGLSLGISIVPQTNGQVTGIWFRGARNLGPVDVHTVKLWSVDADDDTPAGTLLGSGTLSNPSPGAWNFVPLDTPVNVSANVLYRASVHNTAGKYCATNSYWTGVDKTSTGGGFKAFHNGDNPTGLGTQNQGTFNIDATHSYPYHVNLATNYWIDVQFVESAAPTFDSTQFFPYFA